MLPASRCEGTTGNSKERVGRQCGGAARQVHEKRKVKEHLLESHWPELSVRLSEAYGETGYVRALSLLKQTDTWLERINPDAAASLR